MRREDFKISFSMMSAVALLLLLFVFVFESRLDMTTMLLLGSLIVVLLGVFWYLWALNAANKRRMQALAYLDPLTGLRNWAWMQSFVGELLKKQKHKDYILVVIKMRHLRMVNGLFGYEGGDDALRRVASAISCRRKDFVCHCKNLMGSFSLLLEDRPDKEAIDLVLELCAQMSDQVSLKQFRASFRCGLVRLSRCDYNLQAGVDAAKFVMKKLPRHDASDVAFYDDKARESHLWSQKIKADLPEALAKGDFLVYYQPKVDVKTERLIGAEALIRWNYQGQGILPPGKFVPVFEEDGSIAQLDRFVFRSVCEKMKEWQDKKYPLFPVSVNLSRVQLNNTRLVEELMDIVHQCGIPISMIDVELTESAAFGDMGRLLQVMNSIKQGKFRLSMDDFGTGYSSLSLLKDMPLDTLKLDKSFIDALDFEHTDAKENLVTKEIVVLTKRLHIGCLAEGVETKEQRDLLAKYGCDFIQGYYYSKPVPAEEYEKILLRGFVKTEAR